MFERYAEPMHMDLGEAIHVKSVVKPNCDQEIPFTIREARWELVYIEDYEEEVESVGDCVIAGHEIDAFISPKRTGTYKLRYIYEIADETWVDAVKIEVE